MSVAQPNWTLLKRNSGTKLQSSGLGAEFHSEVSRIISRLSVTPFIYQIAYKDVRRAIVHRFPYLVWYRVLGERVTVLACTHGRQDPNQTVSRLR